MFIPYEVINERMGNKELSPFYKLSLEDFDQCYAEPSKDKIKRLLLAIDCQNDFMEGGPLGVPGSLKDMERTAKFLYNNMQYITEIICTLDTHSPKQIFHTCWWTDCLGGYPPPYTIITLDSVKKGEYFPSEKYEEITIEYLEALEEAGKQLIILPYHCLKGTKGATLEENFSKMVYLHSILRNTKPIFIEKGSYPFAEQYGFIYCEGKKDEFDKRVAAINLNLSFYDEIYVVGQAASHCVLESVKQILETDAFGPKFKIIVLTDCMSSIPGYEDKTEKEFAKLKDEYGIILANSTDIDLSK